MNQTISQSQPPVKQKMKPAYLALAIGIAVFAIVCTMLLYFQVEEISCEGSYLYSAQQVIEASDITVGDNLVSIQKAKASSLIMSELPFVESVHIERVVPHSVVIYITERDASFVISDAAGNGYLVSGDGTVEGELQSIQLADYPTIEGITCTAPVIGKNISAYTESGDTLDVLLELIKVLDMYGITGGVKNINVEAVNDISVNYDDRLDIYFGSMDDIEYKAAYFAGMLRDWDTNRTGVVDLTFDVEPNARFQPY